MCVERHSRWTVSGTGAHLVVEVVAELQHELWRADVDVAVEEVRVQHHGRVVGQDLEGDGHLALAVRVVEEQQLARVAVQSHHQVIYHGLGSRALLHQLEHHCHDGVVVLLALLLVEGCGEGGGDVRD